MAKKAKTVKELGTDLNQLLVIVENLKKELNDTKIFLNSKIEKLESDIKTNEVGRKIISTRKNEKVRNLNKCCRKCEFIGDTNKEIKNHMINMHPQMFECNTCESSFSRRSDLEEHISATHEMVENFQCDECEQKFVLEWRLRKHLEMHKNNVKFCHFYNNNKICVFEKIGCKFRHKTSPQCKFGKACTRKLCQYRHEDNHIERNPSHEDSDVMETSDNVYGKVRKETELQKESFYFFCENFCNEETMSHLCCSSDFKWHIGIKMKQIVEKFDPEEMDWFKYYPCNVCDNVSTDLDAHKEHFDENHSNAVFSLKCICDNCEFIAKTIGGMTGHILTKHQVILEKRLNNTNK